MIRKRWLIALLLFVLSCKGPISHSPNLKAYLSKTEVIATDLKEGDPKILEFQNKFMKTFSDYNNENLRKMLPQIYAEDAYLNDRLGEVIGKDKIIDYFFQANEAVIFARFVFEKPTHEGIEFYFPWTMEIKPKRAPDELWQFKGLSRIRFNRQGQVIFHYDYWDVSELMSHISVIGAGVSLLKHY